ncbi:SpoIIE family protein phosphatase [Streptomyces roseirectus]|uniref:SpoIIE family protein phosphatase n=1 Tax=Streptomyces roseirectus TaxID=2768066 RepID=A0A7H0I6U2_9ACTN|nr:SpoIIE family protein phosphatase [Streptomyces roseirectus]QNP68508.1 SpoIIE family protein phosphatase [Streptomyces roseirectus]
MPSPLSADRPAAQPGPVDALISLARRLRGDVAAVRRDTQSAGCEPADLWQRALYDLALHQLTDLDTHLAQLRDGPASAAETAPAAPRRGSLLSRVGSAEWNLMSDEAVWSAEFHRILGRDPAAPALTLDEFPSLLLEEDRPKLTAMVTDCLVDSRPIDGEFRVVRPGGEVRTVHMMGEPVLGADGCTASMWAVLRDVSELRRSQRAVTETRDSLRRSGRRTRSGARLAVETQEAAPPPWCGVLRLPRQAAPTLDVAGLHLPAAGGPDIGTEWFDTVQLPGGDTLLTVGSLTGQSAGLEATTTMLLGAVRGMALAGTEPGRLLGLLGQLVGAGDHPVLAAAVCCRYRPATRTLTWAQAGPGGPVLVRGGAGRRLGGPGGPLLGSAPGAVHRPSETVLEPGDVLLLHTDPDAPVDALAARLARAGTAAEGAEAAAGPHTGEDAACVLVARVRP